MGEPRFKTLIVLTHPIQYMSPILRDTAKHPKLDLTVAYCSLEGAQHKRDPEFGVEVVWDIPLLEGYSWIHVPNRSPWPGVGRFLGLINPGLWNLIRDGAFDAVVPLTGYMHATFWISLAAAKSKRQLVLFGGDAHEIAPRDGKVWKTFIKKRLWPRLFRLADVVVVPSSGGVALMRSIGIPTERVVLTPYAVDNQWWLEQSARVDRASVRAEWGVPEDASVVLFCAKLQPWKRPHDVLRAFSSAAVENSYLVVAGDGPLRKQLEQEARSIGLADRVRFIGFVNQTKLPAVYCSADLFVLSSEYEAFGVVVNEAMLCGCPVIVSDHVGARFDLVRDAETGFVYPVGNVEFLARLLGEILPARDRLKRMANAARERMANWSPAENIEGLVEAIERAATFRRASQNRQRQ